MSIRLNASGEYVRRTTNLPSSTNFTLCGWVRITSRGSQYQFWGLEDGLSNPSAYVVIGINIGNNFEIASHLGNAAFGSWGSGVLPDDGDWFFYAITCAGTGGTDLKGYVIKLGEAAFTSVSTGGASFTPVALTLGNDGWDEYFTSWDGAYTKVYDAVLTEAELYREMWSGRPQRVANLNAWWPHFGGATERLRDYGANGYDLSTAGTPSDVDGPPVPWGFYIPTIPPFAPSESLALQGAFSLSFIEESLKFSNSISLEADIGTSDAQSLNDNVALNLPDDAGATGLLATHISFDSDGYTLNFSNVKSAPKYLFTFAIEESLGGITLKSIPDTGLGSDSLANLVVSLSVSDVGSGLMTLTPSASVPMTDAGSGSDAISLPTISVPIPDISVAVDGIDIPTVDLLLTELGYGIDSTPTVLVDTIPIADAGTGADIIDDILASVTIPDLGSGADAINLAAKILAISDTANASDFISNIAVNFTISETGTGTETLTAIVSLSVSDTASGLDEIDVLKALLKEVGDAGSGTETVAITNSFTVGDIATGTDTPQITVVLSIADVGSAIDAVNVITDILKEIGDAGSGIDSLSISTSLAIADVGAGTDSLQSITTSLTVSDAGSAIDAVNVISAALIEVDDTGAGADAIANITASIIVTDAGAGAEAIPISVSLAVADTASGIEAINIAIHLFKQVADIGQGTDNITTSAQVVVTDLAVATDLVNQILVQAVVQDVAGAIESIQIDTGSDYIYVTLTLSGNQSAASAGSNKTEIGLGANKSTLSI